jgi:N-methylhydantoinase A
LVTEGFEDLLELGRLVVGSGSLQAAPTKPLVSRRRVRGVHERMQADGTVRIPVSDLDIRSVAEDLVRDGVEAIAICFLHAYRYPSHERQAAQLIREEFPGIDVWNSADVWPEIREYERALVTCINAYVGARVRRYYDVLSSRLRSMGIRGSFLASQGNGGVARASDAAIRPIITLQSGPAAGVSAAWQIAQSAGAARIISLDVGGTSTDVAILDNGIRYSNETRIADIPVVLPLVDVSSVGAGGGSVAWTDEGVLKVGPRSAGAVPGPAAYGRGGQEPTLTDAYVILGLLRPGRMDNGIVLDGSAAEAAFRPIAAELGIPVSAAADAVVRIATSAMFAEVSRLSAGRGLPARELDLFAYGGAGPTHAFLLADELGLRRVMVPDMPGLLCALGCVTADAVAEFVATVHTQIRASDRASVEIQSALQNLLEQALHWCDDEGVGADERVFAAHGDLRYVGQSYSLTIEFPEPWTDVDGLLAAFHERHRSAFGHSDEAATVELLNVRLTATGRLPKPPIVTHSSNGEVQRGSRTISLDGRKESAAVYRRDHLPVGFRRTGPAVVEQYDTTVFIPREWRFTVGPQVLLGERSQ